MIIKFEVENYLSFKDKAIFDLTAADITEFPDNVYESDDTGFLKSSILYGANSSGKSNLFRAMLFFNELIQYSQKQLDNDSIIPRITYLLDEKYYKKPTYMSITVLCEDDIIYEYSALFDNNHIIEEELNRFNDDTEEYDKVFKREDSEVHYEGFGNKKNNDMFSELVKSFLRRNSLFLSVLYSSNMQDPDVMRFFSEINEHRFLRVRSDFDMIMLGKPMRGRELHRTRAVARRMENRKTTGDMAYIEKINCIIKAADVDIVRIDSQKIKELEDENVVRTRLVSEHKTINENGEEKIVAFNTEEFESDGTKGLIGLAPDLVDIIDNNGVIIFDEMDTSFHPLLTQMIVKLINSKKSNKKGQLIFSAHDISLIDNYSNIFRRDQIYFCEKINSSSHIYSLYDIKGSNKKTIRKDENFARNYIRGKYKAIPIVKDIDEAFFETCKKNTENMSIFDYGDDDGKKEKI